MLPTIQREGLLPQGHPSLGASHLSKIITDVPEHRVACRFIQHGMKLGVIRLTLFPGRRAPPLECDLLDAQKFSVGRIHDNQGRECRLTPRPELYELARRWQLEWQSLCGMSVQVAGRVVYIGPPPDLPCDETAFRQSRERISDGIARAMSQ